MSQSPYQSPQFSDDPSAYARTPAVWNWYVAYCIFMAILYAAVTVLGYFFLTGMEELVPPDEDVEVLKIQGIVFMVMGVPLAAMFAVAPFLSKTKFAWIYGFVTIAIGLTSACCWPATIPLLIFWMKPDTKAFFNVG